MESVYNFVAGPLAWVSFIIFFGGLICKFISMVNLAKNKDPFIGNYLSLQYGLRSIIMWLIPFVPRNSKLNPAMTVATFVFHICLLLAPIFLMAHVLMIDNSIGLSWFTIPDTVADTMTFLVVACCVYFAIRRMTQVEAKYVTTPGAFLILLVVAAPFITGFLAYHQIGDYMTMLIIHILCGELMLVLIPFTWLSHMLFFPMTRAYMGSEFGGVRNVKDW